MNPLESDWFFQMVERGGKTPAEKLVAIFSVTENWITAPGIRASFLQTYPVQGHFLHACSQLKRFLTGLAIAARIEKPEILASHLVILLQGAIAEELRNPGLHPLSEAAKAAEAVICGARPKPHAWLNLRYASGMAASLCAVMLMWHLQAAHEAPVMARPGLITARLVTPLPYGISPGQMEATLVLHEQFEKGVCPVPQLMALPSGQMTAYMNVINFRTPDNPAADRENIRAFLAWYNQARSPECYMPPRNGHTTVTWTKG